MRKRKINIEFGRYKEADLLAKAKLIIGCLKNNSYFPVTIPPLNEVEAAYKAFSDALSGGTRNGKVRTEIKRKARLALIEILRRLGIYLQMECKGDVAKMLSTGFTVSKLPQPVGPPAKPSNFRVNQKLQGRMQLKCNRVKYSKGYHWEYRKVNEEIWKMEASTAASKLLEGLEKAQEYVFRVSFTVAAGNSPCSDEIRAVVI
jgi:hypothetical protein